MIAFALFFGVSFCLFLALAFFLAFTSSPVVRVAPSPPLSAILKKSGLPWVPQTVAQAHAMNPTDFELLSIAIIIAMGQGHTFHRHTGQSGDQGVDAKLLNINNMLVAVQSKRYAERNHIAPEQVLSFWGAIHRHRAIYGYFVTTSQFSIISQQIIDASNELIRPIGEDKLALLLQQRSYEIAMAYRDVLVQKQAS